MVATSTSSRHARTPCGDSHTIRINYNPQFFSLWILVDPWTVQNKTIFVPSFILLTRISPTKPLSKSLYLPIHSLSNSFILRIYSKMFLRFTFSQTVKSSTRNSFSIFFGSSMLNSLRRLLYSSSRFLVRYADENYY